VLLRASTIWRICEHALRCETLCDLAIGMPLRVSDSAPVCGEEVRSSGQKKRTSLVCIETRWSKRAREPVLTTVRAVVPSKGLPL